MPFLQDVVGQAENQIKNNSITGTVNSVKNAVGIAESNIKNTLANGAANAVNTGVKSVAGAAATALNQALAGNVAGAISSLNPATLASSALSGLGSFSSSLNLSDPGQVAAISGTGGVNPGDALNGALARPDPLLSFLWYCQLPVVGAPAGSQGPAASGVASITNSISNLVSSVLGQSSLASPLGGAQVSASSSQLPWYYVEEASCPFRNFDTASIFRDGRQRHYPNKYNVANLRLGIYADVANTSIQYLQAWNNAILSPFASTNLQTGGGWGRAAGYKLPIYVYIIDVTKSTLAIIQYTECWPVSMADYGLNSGSSDRIINHVEFSVGDVFINLMNIPPDLTALLVNNPLSNAVNGIVGNGLNAITNVVHTASAGAVNSVFDF